MENWYLPVLAYFFVGIGTLLSQFQQPIYNRPLYLQRNKIIASIIELAIWPITQWIQQSYLQGKVNALIGIMILYIGAYLATWLSYELAGYIFSYSILRLFLTAVLLLPAMWVIKTFTGILLMLQQTLLIRASISKPWKWSILITHTIAILYLSRQDGILISFFSVFLIMSAVSFYVVEANDLQEKN